MVFAMSGRVTTGVGLLIVLVAAALGLLLAQPPAEVGSEASPERFSSARAFSTVVSLAGEPRPIGSAAHASARESLARELTDLGLEVEAQDATVTGRRRSGRIEAARVRNLLARFPGRGVEGAVLLLAHYDTRPQTPGAADDAAGLATILETLRALTAEPQPQRDVLVAITDGEEYGLFGARALVEQSPWVDEIEFLINIEARGNRGLSMMFETTPGNLELVQIFAGQAPYPFGNSLSYEVYRRMPNDSDFSAFRETQVAGLNFALIGNHSSYHTALDSADRLDQRSLQHHGSNVLALTRHLSNLGQFSRSGEDAVYFSVSPTRLIVYPASTARVLGLGLVAMAAAALFRARGTGARGTGVWSASGLVRGGVLAVATTVGGYSVGFVFWKALQLVAPMLFEAPHGRPYRTLWFGGAIALLVLALVVEIVRRLEAYGRPLELLAGALLVWTLLAAALSFWIPGASYLLTWPAASAWITWWIVARAGSDQYSGGVQIASALGAAVGGLIFIPTLVLFLQALTLSGAAVPAALLGLLLTLVIPQLVSLARSGRASLLLLGAALCVILVAAALSGRNEARPRPNTLFYSSSAEGDFWYTMDSGEDTWTAEFLGQDPEQLSAPSGLALGSRLVRRAPAEDAGLEAPWLESTDSLVDGNRSVLVKVGSGNGGQVLYVRCSSEMAIESAWIGESRVDVGRAPDGVRMRLLGVSSETDPWELRFDLAGEAPLDFEVLEQRFGLPAVGGSVPQRPPEFIPSSSWRTDSTYIQRRLAL